MSLDLPGPLLPYKTFRARLQELGFQPLTVDAGGSYQARWQGEGLSFVVEHSGYGGGFGGHRPVRVVRYYISFPYRDVPAEKQRVVEDIIGKLAAPGPAVHGYHPLMLQDRLDAFWRETECKQFRAVFAPSEIIDELRGDSMRERWLAYQRVAERLGLELRVERPGKGPIRWPVVFRGKPADMVIDDLIGKLGLARYKLHGGTTLMVEGRSPISTHITHQLANRIANQKRRGGATRIEVDATEDTSITLTGDAATIKAALRRLIDQAKAKAYRIDIDGEVEVAKQRKLPKLAARLRSLVEKGATIVVAPDRPSRPAASLDL